MRKNLIIAILLAQYAAVCDTVLAPPTPSNTTNVTVGTAQPVATPVVTLPPVATPPQVSTPAPTATPTPVATPLSVAVPPHVGTPFPIPGTPTIKIPFDPLGPIGPERSTPFGVWGGRFDVDPDGAATYVVPIEVPPGRAGLQPTLSFQYHSNRGFGPLGVGWSLAGLGQIHRGGKSYAADGVLAPVKFYDDNFCLDGERLVLKHGIHEHAGAEYRTERDRFSRVVAGEVDAGEVSGFTVQTADGRIVEYGFSSSARVRGPGSKVRAWLMSKVSDRYGNYMIIEYERVTTSAHPAIAGEDTEIVPSRILYTGNTGSAGASPLTPARSVDLRYDAHPMPFHGFSSGVAVATTRRLREVTTFVSGQVVRRYRLNYSESPATGRSLLSAITQCDAQDVCLPSLTFDYEQGTTEFLPGIIVAPLGIAPGHVWLEDASGDGRADLTFNTYIYGETILRQATSDYDKRNPTADPFRPSVATGARFPGQVERMERLDFERDGDVDMLVRSTGSNNWQLARWSVSDYTVTELDRYPRSDDTFLDLNGDGFADVAWCDFGGPDNDYVYFHYLLGDGVSFADAGSRVGHALTGPWGFITQELFLGLIQSDPGMYLDVNGDGAMDILARAHTFVQMIGLANNTPATHAFYDMSLDALSSRNPPTPPLPADLDSDDLQDLVSSPLLRPLPADLNGDGLMDLLVRGRATQNLVWISNGNGFQGGQNGITATSDNLAGIGTAVADWNGDGKDDFLAKQALILPILGRPSVQVPLPGTLTLYLSGSPASMLRVQPTEIPVAGDYQNFAIGDVDGNGVPDVLAWDGTNHVLYLNNSQRPDLLTAVHEATPATTYAVTYANLADPEVYRSDVCSSSYPTMCVPNGSNPVVASFTADAGPGNPRREWRYKYENALIDLRGRGWLGFARIVVTDVTAGTTSRYWYDQTYDDAHDRYPYLGMVTLVVEDNFLRTPAPANYWERRTEITPQRTEDGKTYFPWISRVFMREWIGDLHSLQFGSADPARSSDTKFSQIDAFGNAWWVSTKFGDGWEELSERRYLNDSDPATWLIGRLESETATSTSPRGSRTRYTTWEWDRKTGALVQTRERRGPQAIEPTMLETIYGRDAYGNVDMITLRDVKRAEDRISSFTHDDPERMFAQLVANPLGHQVQRRFDPGTGKLTNELDANGQSLRLGYDGFGRPLHIIHSDATETTVEFAPRTVQRDGYQIVVSRTGQPLRAIEYDRLGRPIMRATVGFDGQALAGYTRYDALGRVSSQSLPFLATAIRVDAYSYEYDERGRLIRFTEPGGTRSLREYSIGQGDSLGRTNMGTSVTLFDGLNQATKLFYDSRGQPETVVNALGDKTQYRYGAFGVPEEVEDANGNVTKMLYDDVGFRRELHDPDLGKHAYDYNAFGEVLSVTDAAGAKTTFEYDKLGRCTKSVHGGVDTRWTYDTAPNGIGRIASTTSADGHLESYTYDAAGRLDSITTTLSGGAYATNFAYDSAGRLWRMYYPDAGVGNERFGTEIEYKNGFVSAVRSLRTGAPYWTLLESDESGNAERERYGNGVETARTFYPFGHIETIRTASATGVVHQNLRYWWDDARNLTARQDLEQNRTEGFGYDKLNRIRIATVGTGLAVPPPGTGTDIVYDAIDNPLERGVTNYIPGGRAPSGRWLPHAVGVVTPGPPVITPGRSFIYDESGNLEDNREATFTWTSFNKVRKATAVGGPEVCYEYDANQLLVRRTSLTDTYFVHGWYEQQHSATGIEHRFRVFALGRLVAEVTRVGSGTETVSYYHEDHLGSIDAVTDDSGALIEKRSYDVFGKPRATNWSQTAAAPTLTRRAFGFGGHRDEIDLGLVDMGGRMYDPTIGVFLSPDPFVQAPLSSQSLNRYSYALNNPLSRIDPTGFQSESVGTESPFEWHESAGYDVGTITGVRRPHISPRESPPVSTSPNSPVFGNPRPVDVHDNPVNFTTTQSAAASLSGPQTYLADDIMLSDEQVAVAAKIPAALLAGGLTVAVSYRFPRAGLFLGLLALGNDYDQAELTGVALAGGGPLAGRLAGRLAVRLAGAAKTVANPVPSTMARVIPEGIPATTLGRPGAADVFVTAADDIAGMNASQIANRLGIPESSTGFRVFEFPTPQSGVASPVFRTDPGFFGRGRTIGDVREFVIPNGPIPSGAVIRTVP